MSAGQQMLLGGGAGIVANGVTFTNDVDTSIGTPASLSSTFSSAGAFSSVSDPSNWFLPNTTGIGSLYWVFFTRSSGNVFTIGTEGVWLSLSAGQTVGWSAQTLARSWIGTAQFATDSGGVNIVASDSLNMSITKS